MSNLASARDSEKTRTFFETVSKIAQLDRYKAQINCDYGYIESDSFGKGSFYWEFNLPIQSTPSKEFKGLYVITEPLLMDLRGETLRDPSQQEVLQALQRTDFDHFKELEVTASNIRKGQYYQTHPSHRPIFNQRLEKSIECHFNGTGMALVHYTISEASPKIVSNYSMEQKGLQERLQEDIKFAKDLEKMLIATAI